MRWGRGTLARLSRGGWLETNFLFALAVILLLVFAFVKIADEVTDGNSRDFDHAAIEWFRHPGPPHAPIGPKALPEIARDVTALGGAAVLTLLTALVATALWLRRRRRLVALLIVSCLGATLLSGGMKRFFERDRPAAAYQLMPVSSMSFPSGHSTLSAAVYLLLGLMLATASPDYRSKIFFIAAGALLPLLVGLTRVYLGAHFPTDVAAGWCVGAAWALGSALVAHRLERPSRP